MIKPIFIKFGRFSIVMLKIGVVGAGHLGKIHLKILKESSFIDLMGFYDINDDVSKQVTTSLM